MEWHRQSHVQATEGVWNTIRLDGTRHPAAWGQSGLIIDDVFITFLFSGQWNGAHRRCTWGIAANMRRIYNPQIGRRGRPLTWVTGSRPLLQVIFPTWLARLSNSVGFLVARFIRSLVFLKCTFYQLEWFLCCYGINLP